MAKLNLIDIEEAPQPDKLTSKVREARRMYENYIVEVTQTGKVGVLEMEEGERIGSIRMALSHASRRTGTPIQMWAADNHLYFAPTGDEPKVRSVKNGNGASSNN